MRKEINPAATTSKLEKLNPSWRIATRFHKHLHLSMTKPSQRLKVLEYATNKLGMEYPLSEIAQQTHAYTPADLIGLVNQAHMLMDHGMDEAWSQALIASKPSQLASDYALFQPTISFGDLFGIDSTTCQLQNSIIDPLLHPEKFIRLGLQPPRGLLIVGQPGTGKTVLAQAISKQLAFNLIVVDAPTIRNKIVGQSESNLSKLFQSARENAPCVILLDNIHMLAPPRGSETTLEGSGARIVATMLMELDGVEHKLSTETVFVIGTAPSVDLVDEAIRRPGRLDELIVMKPLDSQTKIVSVLKGFLQNKPHNLTAQDLNVLADAFQPSTPAEIENRVNQAALEAIRQDVSALSLALFQTSLLH